MPPSRKLKAVERTETRLEKMQEVRERINAMLERKRLESKRHLNGDKKGFMNPERKEKLRMLLKTSFNKSIQAENERKNRERLQILEQRIGTNEHGHVIDEKELIQICKKYHERIVGLEETKYDLEVKVRARDYKLNELIIQVNELKGKFVRPSLREVPKFDSRFTKPEKSPGQSSLRYRDSLRTTGINKFALTDIPVYTRLSSTISEN